MAASASSISSWIVSDGDRVLYGEAEGYGASDVVLSSKLSVEAYLRAKKSLTGKQQPCP